MDTIKFDDQEFRELQEKIIRLRDLMDRTEVSMTRARRMLSAETDKFDEITGKFCQRIKRVHKSLEQLQYQGSQIIRVYGNTEIANIKMVDKLRNGTDDDSGVGTANGRIYYGEIQAVNYFKINHSNYINPDIHHEGWLVRATDKLIPDRGILVRTEPCVRPNISFYKIFRRGGER